MARPGLSKFVGNQSLGAAFSQVPAPWESTMANQQATLPRFYMLLLGDRTLTSKLYFSLPLPARLPTVLQPGDPRMDSE